MYGSCQQSLGITPRYASAAELMIASIAACSSRRQDRIGLIVAMPLLPCPSSAKRLECVIDRLRVNAGTAEKIGNPLLSVSSKLVLPLAGERMIQQGDASGDERRVRLVERASVRCGNRWSSPIHGIRIA